jgi:hypothetical protein
MEPNWEQIEEDIKATDEHWIRYMFLSEQIGHAYINLYVEKGREYNIPKFLCKAVAYLTMLTPIPGLITAYAMYNWENK